MPNLRDDITYLKGVGPQRSELLHRVGLHRAFDLLFYFPRDYQDMTQICPVDGLKENVGGQTVCGYIEEWSERSSSRGPMLTLTIQCGEKYVRGIWWKMSFIKREFAKGRKLLFTGRPKYDYPFWIMMHPQITYLADTDDEKETEPFLPVYPLTEGLKQFHLRRILREMLPVYAPLLDEVFPADFLEQHKLLPIADAVQQIHFPADKPAVLWAKRRFVYQELFILQLGLAVRRLQHRIQFNSPQFTVNKETDSRIRQRFPFDLTKPQEKVIKEIVSDLSQPFPMNRLLQGDVGSGKTVVALYAMLAAVANGYQAVFMAPTEVLARQHLRTLSKMLEGSQVKLAPLFGGQRPNARASILQSVSTGESQIIVGTQAIICSEIPFHQLGLVVIDEQHKFGVRQRAALKTGRGVDPHYLVMTATPIPRSVTMTLFGDLDVSMMDGMPPGRQKVKTYIIEPEKQTDWWTFFRRKAEEEGWQGYVVVPLIEESFLSADGELSPFEGKPAAANLSLTETFQQLSQNELKGLRLAYIHGRMTTEEKEK
ncbi:MAG: DEAD/DEAH box helicase, partial [Planctomycetaceae bacterium]|nr:DEAD/DEAH box helicase [Planctomycetaceae bacterium]